MSKGQVDAKFKSEGRCRLCLRPAHVRPLTRHRIIPGSVGGRYIAVNCVPLCRWCHDLVDNRDVSTKRRARQQLRASMWPEEIAFAQRMRHFPKDPLARPWSFDRMYARPTRELVLERRALVA